MWSTQLLFVMVRARIERKRKAPATKLDAEVAASLGLLDVVEGLAEGESLPADGKTYSLYEAIEIVKGSSCTYRSFFTTD